MTMIFTTVGVILCTLNGHQSCAQLDFISWNMDGWGQNDIKVAMVLKLI